MTRFIAGIAVAVIVHMLGWPRVEAAFKAVNAGAQKAYHSAETQLRNSEVGK